MSDVAALLDKAKKAMKASSDAELSRSLGVTRASVSNWRSGRNYPDAVQCATIAGVTGVPLARVLGIVGEARAISREEKSVWRKLAASAAAVFLMLAATLPAATPAKASGMAAQEATEAFQPSGICIMRRSAYSRLHAAMGQALQVAPPPSARSPVTLPRLHMTPVQFIGGCRGTVSPLQVAAGRSPRCSKPALEPTGYLPARRRWTPHRNREQALLLETSAARNGRRRQRLQLLLSGPPVRLCSRNRCRSAMPTGSAACR
ncbi:helix-turn-helix domain-containing protein [Thermomonas sp.]|uniref:helix-turn-helix domain-containing protein n=1 Tax=Thermomonas sp. TaxID=1971895 RepID=UPI0035B3C336